MSQASAGRRWRWTRPVAAVAAAADLAILVTVPSARDGWPVAVVLALGYSCLLMTARTAHRAGHRLLPGGRSAAVPSSAAPRRSHPDQQPSPVMIAAMISAREGHSAWYVARVAGIPPALAELLVQDAQNAGPE